MLGRWFFLAVVGIALYTYVSQSEPSGAVSASVTQSCSVTKPGTATVTLVWPATQAGAQQTWFDISVAPGFAPGWFQGWGPLPVTQTAYAFDGLPNGVTFYYRVNTLYAAGWRETASGSFVATCGGSGGGASATGKVTQACDGGNGVTVTFDWAANAQGPQWLDLSVFNNSFAAGSFVGAGPVASGGRSFLWYGLARGAINYWRVNALTTTGWSSSNTASFATLTCQDPIKACIGFMAGLSASGRAECDQLMSGPDTALAGCLKFILNVPGGGAANCAQVGGHNQVIDCLLGLAGMSHFGKVSCRLYYNT